MRALTAAGAALAVVVLAGCGSEEPVPGPAPGSPQTAASEPESSGVSVDIKNDMDVISARIPAPPTGATTAQLEMTLADIDPAGPDALRAATSPAAQSVAFTSSGHPVASIAIPVAAGAAISTGPPNPDRILLTGLRRPLRAGQSVTITLTFARAGQATLQVPIVPPVP